MKSFDKLIQTSKTILIIGSSSLDLDCLGSGLVLKKYLESKGKKVSFYFPEAATEKRKEIFSYIPYFSEVTFSDTRPVLNRRCFDLLILIDGSSWGQFYDINKPDTPPDPAVYPQIVVVDHHLTKSGELGTLVIADSRAGATAEVLLDKIIPMKCINRDLATLAYAAIAGDTGNFRWNFTPKTLTIAASLVEKEADTNLIIDRLFFNLSREYFQALSWILEHADFRKDLKTAFLWIDRETIKKEDLKEERMGLIVRAFAEEVAKKLPEFPRGIIVSENAPNKIEISGRGNNFHNKISLPSIFAQLEGSSGGHFNAAGADIEGDFDKVKKDLIGLIKENLSKAG